MRVSKGQEMVRGKNSRSGNSQGKLTYHRRFLNTMEGWRKQFRPPLISMMLSLAYAPSVFLYAPPPPLPLPQHSIRSGMWWLRKPSSHRQERYAATFAVWTSWYNGKGNTTAWTKQIRFLIGGEHVTCRGPKLTNSLGKQHELSTRTWSGRAPWNSANFVSKSAQSKRFIAVLSWKV